MDDWWFRRWRRYVDELIREMEEDLDRILREFEEERIRRPFREWERGEKTIGPYIYGYRIYIGPDGRPHIEEFGNVKKSRGRPIIMEEREPLVDVLENPDEITVVAELPGVEKDNIKIEVSEDKKKLVIKASDTNRKYYKEIDLPSEVEPDSAKANYKNGVLEVKLKKIKKERKGFEIKIE
ncbi:MAG: archaeal heat shock protein Hsp20 [Desulfurococcaceae archaeon]|uniref:Hsp20/alpha crystallin family protein n=1 Tax=Staphylothermus marinus TaxID=2280 RepID=A0A7C4H8B4_STAMA